MADPEIERFFRENFAVIRAKCARMLDGEEASDVAQEAFVRLCESGVVHEQAAARAAWIYRTCTRLAIDRLRRRGRGVETAAGPGSEAAGGAAPADEVLAARQLLAAVAGLVPADELELAVLCRVDGLTQVEAAEVTRRSERSVRRLLARLDGRLATLAGTDRRSP